MIVIPCKNKWLNFLLVRLFLGINYFHTSKIYWSSVHSSYLLYFALTNFFIMKLNKQSYKVIQDTECHRKEVPFFELTTYPDFRTQYTWSVKFYYIPYVQQNNLQNIFTVAYIVLITFTMTLEVFTSFSGQLVTLIVNVPLQAHSEAEALSDFL